MEADDDTVPEPDAKGHLDLTNRAWVNLDSKIWTFAVQLVILDISYNHIHELPQQIGQMVLLKELHCSFNKITTIPDSIGRLKRLRLLKLNSNRLITIPPELGKLEQLEELNLNENLLEQIPATIALCPVLRSLKLQNNKLKTLPSELAEILTLEELVCENNPQLDMVPEKWRGHSISVIFILKVHQVYRAKMEEMSTTNSDLVKHCQFLEQEQMLMQENVLEMRENIDDLKKNIPKNIQARMERDAKIRAESEADMGDEKSSGCNIL